MAHPPSAVWTLLFVQCNLSAGGIRDFQRNHTFAICLLSWREFRHTNKPFQPGIIQWKHLKNLSTFCEVSFALPRKVKRVSSSLLRFIPQHVSIVKADHEIDSRCKLSYGYLSVVAQYVTILLIFMWSKYNSFPEFPITLSRAVSLINVEFLWRSSVVSQIINDPLQELLTQEKPCRCSRI